MPISDLLSAASSGGSHPVRLLFGGQTVVLHYVLPSSAELLAQGASLVHAFAAAGAAIESAAVEAGDRRPMARPAPTEADERRMHSDIAAVCCASVVGASEGDEPMIPLRLVRERPASGGQPGPDGEGMRLLWIGLIAPADLAVLAGRIVEHGGAGRIAAFFREKP